MIQIRNGVFETNSSSSHSICINNSAKNDCMDIDNIIDNLLNGRGVWKLKDTDITFGRAPFRYLSKFSEKILYAIACRVDIHDITDIVKDIIPEFTEFKFEHDNPFEMWWGTDDAILEGWLEHNNVSLRDFLTGNQYFVICDGDEYCIFSDMIKCGIVDDSKLKRDRDWFEDEDE